MTTIFTSHKLSLDECPKNLHRNLSSWDSLNPSYEFKYYNDKEMKRWMEENTEKEPFSLFDRINTGAGRADMFRICHLYVDGGVWVDTDLPAFDINQQSPRFEEILKNSQAILVRNRKCDNPRYTLIAGIRENKLFSMLRDLISQHIKEALNNRTQKTTMSITGPFVLHELLLTLCGFENVLIEKALAGGLNFDGLLSLDTTYKINGASFTYIDDIVPEKRTYSEENVYLGYEEDLKTMNVVPHSNAEPVK